MTGSFSLLDAAGEDDSAMRKCSLKNEKLYTSDLQINVRKIRTSLVMEVLTASPELVIVASTNPVKINSVKLGFAEMFPSRLFDFKGIEAASGVSDQPIGHEETRLGSKNRVENSLKAYPDADWYVGLEGGCILEETIEGSGASMYCIAYISIFEKRTKRWSCSTTGRFLLPNPLAKLVADGMELGLADAKYFNRSESCKKQDGTIGHLTGGILNRTTYYSHAVSLALVPFSVQSEHYYDNEVITMNSKQTESAKVEEDRRMRVLLSQLRGR
jgi:inosine/xanthosine triphosphatase